MKVRHLFVAILAGAAVNQTATTQDRPQSSINGNQVSMCVTTAIGTCGNFCQPFDCTPTYTLVSSYESMVVDIAGAPLTSFVLFYGMAAPGCMKVPGIEGALATWNFATPLAMGTFYDLHYRPDLMCQPAATSVVVSVPFVPPGVDLRFQTLGMNAWAIEPAELSFSRPVEVRTR